MNITLSKYVLLELLDKAASVVPSRDSVPVLKNYLVETRPDKNRLRVSATDMSLSLVVQTDLVMFTDHAAPTERAVFPAKRFFDMVRQSADGDIHIEVADQTAAITSGRTQWVLPLANPDEYPDLPEHLDAELTPVPRDGLLTGLQTVRGAAASTQDVTRAHMMLVDVEGGRMRAGDGVRFHQIEVGDGYPDMQIPVHAVDDLIRLLKACESATVEVGSTDDALLFFIGEDFFVAQKMTSKFPDIDAMLLQPALANDWKLTVDRAELIAAVKRVRITADESTSAVSLVLTKDVALVLSKDKTGSHTREALDAGWTSPDLTITVNHVHLLDLLMMVQSKSCEFWLAPGEKTRPAAVRLLDEDAKITGILTQLRTDFL